MPRRTVPVVQGSGAPKAKRAKALRPITDPADLKARFKDYPAIEVLSRRFTNPNDPGSVAILLTDEHPDACLNSDHINRLRPDATTCHLCGHPARKWYVRWFNWAIDGRAAQMRAKGYVPVALKELPDAEAIADRFPTKTGDVRRGDRGQEVLGKMPLELYLYVKSRQHEYWNKTALSPAKVQDSLANAAGVELGDEAGQGIHDGEIQVERFRTYQSTIGDEQPTAPNPGEIEFGS